ncbi:hypothetical protein RhiirA5_428873 [Rhizophagus irregularis]|uniref:MATA-HMG n=3 Tax=Rhizophagus irregularis TaxID=588596 RepID=A0A1B1EUS4_9GLOM|nr:hypothetical protein GLOIN_2v1784135 [Rhizophagus irregularis DAOM 181602=DAOM 197198]ANQ32567.1 MATA-HMG [Rhizophagus irregularis]EXX56063.1 hypothetical protein RirG_219590 [Rhizophagus irregularis DAOM 197198w]PKB99980.1 hypothetical protein RhiirA5_428873 [Rhizophagus irregularis]POG63412.1 hypothetical protein GLOIN_2v1784135 [Rhizophagus irregularis DAOM 181602=DAOM 197198]UZO28117.1 hypothetical protein OCT59_021660 [Rhizophagus irregularis]|eukprot:XP_025170278.1 hypothetical protein GLOIN_2v1784135 [Rhizophagus irregularis DAOM 181602=DAOM 197198]
MPKESSKKRNRNNLVTNSNFNSNDETNIIINSPNNNLVNIFKPPFPPALTIDDLIKNAQTSDNKPKMVPNAFIAYRMALIREYRIKNKNIKLPRMGVFSRIAENSWNKEPQHVKGYYNKLTQDAKLFYKQNTIQIVLDKHMININDQKREQVRFQESSRDKRHLFCDAKSDIEPIQVNDVSTSHICSINASFKEEIRILQEYVKILEQTIDSLLAVDYKL